MLPYKLNYSYITSFFVNQGNFKMSFAFREFPYSLNATEVLYMIRNKEVNLKRTYKVQNNHCMLYIYFKESSTVSEMMFSVSQMHKIF